MADLIEFTAIPKHGRRFYKLTSNCLSFSVKASRNAKIGLADEPGYTYVDHWIFIDKNGHSGIIEYDDVIVKSSTPRLLIENKFQKFWLTWCDSKIELGKFDESTPILSKKIKKTNLNYVTFSGPNQRNSFQWKFMIPASIERPVLKPIVGGKPYWVPYDGLLPYGALIGGYENEFLYIMRAPHEGSLIPGKFVPSVNCGFIVWDEQQLSKTSFEILCAHDCVWVPTVEDTIPAGAIIGGYTQSGPQTMYIGRVKRDNYIIPGNIIPSQKVCHIAYSGGEDHDSIYEILVAPYSSPRCAHITMPVVKCEDYEEHSNDEDDESQHSFDDDDDDD